MSDVSRSQRLLSATGSELLSWSFGVKYVLVLVDLVSMISQRPAVLCGPSSWFSSFYTKTKVNRMTSTNTRDASNSIPSSANLRWSSLSHILLVLFVYLALGCSSTILPTAGQSLAMTDYYNCYITPETSLACLGFDPTTSLSGAEAYAIPSDLIGFVQVVGGRDHTCGLLGTGEVRCFGNNTFGQSTPPINIQFTFLAAGDYTTCGIMTNGSVTCFGQTISGGFVLAFSSDLLFKHLSCGNYYSNTMLCGVLVNGTLQCVGPHVNQYVTVPTSSRQFVQVTMSGLSICGLLSNGTVQCHSTSSSWPVPSDLCATSITNTSPGQNSVSCAITCSGKIVCWDGILYLVSSSTVAFVQVVVGNLEINGYYQNLCAIDQNGQIQCDFGADISRYMILPGPNQIIGMHSVCVTLANQTIQCGGTAFDLPPANLLSSLSVSTIVGPSPNAITALRVCGINTTHQLQCFQDYNFNAIPTLIYQQSIIDINLFKTDGCVLKSDGRVLCWNDTGLSSLGSLLPPDTPFVSIRAFSLNSHLTAICGLATNGTIFCDGSTGSVNWPIRPFGSIVFAQFSSSPSVNSWQIVCGLNVSNIAFCFSPKSSTESYASLPFKLSAVQFSELVVVDFVAGFLVCGLTLLDQSIWCWGLGNAAVTYHLIGPFHHLMGFANVVGNDHGLCFFKTVDNSLKCLGVHLYFPLPNIFQQVTVGSLAPQYHYRSGTQLLQCPIQTLSTLIGASSPLCDGACQFDNPLCLQTCPIGYYCQPPFVIICPKGTFCQENTIGQPSPCPIGTYGNSTGLPDPGCTGLCPPGYFCDRGTADYLDASCPGGNYCKMEATLAPTPCPVGRFGLGGSIDSNCSGACPPGTYCQSGTIDYHDAPCPPGLFCPDESTIDPIRCPPGSYCEVGSIEPLLCDAGTYGTDGGYATSNCGGYCPAGYLCPNGTTTFINYPCPPGRYCPYGGTITALECDPGYWCRLGSTTGTQIPCGSNSVYCPQGSDTPTPIDSGYYATGSVDGSSLTFSGEAPCDPGHYCDGSGLMKICLLGTYQPNATAISCFNCPIGSYSGPAEVECHSCAAGTYTPDSSLACSNCTAGRYSLNSATSCTPCPLGRFSDIEGLGSPCQECSNGTYADQAGLLECLTCAPPYYNPTSSVCLYCSETVSFDSRSCTSSPCPKNTQYHPLDHTCPKCLLGQYSLAGSSCQPCPPNTYTPHIGYDCISCQQSGMAGLVCVDGLANVTAGYWAYRSYDSISGTDIFYTVECPTGFCLGGALQSVQVVNGTSSSTSTVEVDRQSIQCQFPRLQSSDNYLCGQCADGYLLWNNECHLCEKSNGGLIFLSIILSFALVLFLLRSGSSDSSSISTGLVVILIYFIQIGALEVTNISQYLNWYTIMNFHLQSLSGSGQSSCIAPIQPTGQVILELLTPILLIVELGIISLIHWLLHRYHHRIISQQPVNNLHQASNDRHAIHHQVKSVVHGVISSFDFNRYIGGVLSILLFCYTLVAESCISWFSCITITSDTRVLFRFPNVDCSSSEYHSMLGWVIFVFLVYIIGLPISMVVLLRMKRKFTQLGSTEQNPKRQVQPAQAQIQSDGDTSVIEASLHHNTSGIRSDSAITLDPLSLEHLIFVRRFGCLFRMYHSSAWYWQSVVLFRRLLLVTVQVSLLRLPSYRFLCFSLVNLLSLAIIIHVRPFRSKSVNWMDFVSHLSLIVISQLLSLLPPYPTEVQVGILLLLILPTAVLILGLVQQYWLKRSRLQPIDDANKDLSVMNEMVEIDTESIKQQPLSVVDSSSHLPNALTPNPLHSPSISFNRPPEFSSDASHHEQATSNNALDERESIHVAL